MLRGLPVGGWVEMEVGRKRQSQPCQNIVTVSVCGVTLSFNLINSFVSVSQLEF